MLCCQNRFFLSLKGLSNILSCDILRKRTKPDHSVYWMIFIFSRCTCWNQEDVKERVANFTAIKAFILIIVAQTSTPKGSNHEWHISNLCFYFVKPFLHPLTDILDTSNTSGHVWLNICVPLPVENGLRHVTFTTVGQWMTHLAAV